jgi:hypothetical protein
MNEFEISQQLNSWRYRSTPQQNISELLIGRTFCEGKYLKSIKSDKKYIHTYGSGIVYNFKNGTGTQHEEWDDVDFKWKIVDNKSNKLDNNTLEILNYHYIDGNGNEKQVDWSEKHEIKLEQRKINKKKVYILSLRRISHFDEREWITFFCQFQ